MLSRYNQLANVFDVLHFGYFFENYLIDYIMNAEAGEIVTFRPASRAACFMRALSDKFPRDLFKRLIISENNKGVKFFVEKNIA